VTIRDIGNLPCKIGKTTITVKNQETGKTCGIVRNIQTFGMEVQPRILCDFRLKHGCVPVWIIRKCIEADGIGYYVVDVRRVKALEIGIEHGYEADIEAVEELNENINRAKSHGLEILYLNLV
jgi:hypothetical protein